MKRIIALVVVLSLFMINVNAATTKYYYNDDGTRRIAFKYTDDRKIIYKFENDQVTYKYYFNFDNTLLRRESFKNGVKRQVAVMHKKYLKDVYTYDSDGTLQRVDRYANGVIVRRLKIISEDARVYIYYQKQIKSRIDYYYNGKLDRRIRYTDGHISSLIQYANGRINYIVKYKNGQIAVENIYRYKDGNRYVYKRIYYKNGDYYIGYKYDTNQNKLATYKFYNDQSLINNFYN